MTVALKTIIYPVRNLEVAKATYRAMLRLDPAMDEPYYVQYNLGDQELGLDPNGHSKGMTGPVGYWHVEDIKQTVDDLLAVGGTVQQPINDVGGRLIATVEDADGNLIGLVQPA